MNREYEVTVSILVQAPSAEEAMRYAEEMTKEAHGIAFDCFMYFGERHLAVER